MSQEVEMDVGRALDAAAGSARRRGLAGSPQLVRFSSNVVFRVDDVILRVSPDPRVAAAHVALARWLASQGLPVLLPLGDADTIGGFGVTAWEYVEQRGAAIDYRQYGQAIAHVHRLEPARASDYVQLDWCGDAAWLQLDERLERAAVAGVVPAEDIELLRVEARALDGWQDAARCGPLVVCHGDVHPQNVLTRGRELVIIDWDQLCIGPAEWDHAAMLTWSERWGGLPGDYIAFAAGYGADYRASPLAQTLARVRLLAPTINMIIAGASSEEHAQQARLRMVYWRGDSHAPAWTPG